MNKVEIRKVYINSEATIRLTNKTTNLYPKGANSNKISCVDNEKRLIIDLF